MNVEPRARVGRRPDDYLTRRQHLASMSDEDLRQKFWTLAEEIVRPMVDLARGHTSPSIERSVLLRMGFSSLEAKEIVDRVTAEGLLGKGAGHVVLRAASASGTDARTAGLALLQGNLWDQVRKSFDGGR